MNTLLHKDIQHLWHLSPCSNGWMRKHAFMSIFVVGHQRIILTGVLPIHNSISLTHWGRVMHICVGRLTIIVSDNGTSPDRCQDIIWTTAGILLIGPLGTNFNEIFYQNSCIYIQENAFKNIVCKTAAILSQPQCVNPLRPSDALRRRQHVT